MQIVPITLEQFTAIYNELSHIHQHKPTPAVVAYSGAHQRLGKITITSDPLQCLLFREKAA